MKIVLLVSDDVFAGMLAHPLVRERPRDIITILSQSQIMLPGKGPAALFRHVASKSGWEYPAYQAAELAGYGLVERIRGWTGMNGGKRGILERPSALAKRYGISFTTVHDIHSEGTLARLRSMRPDLLISLRFSAILKKPVLSVARLGTVNFHPSLLPEYAGLGPVFQAVSRGESYIGATVHRMEEEIDTGRPVVQGKIPIRKKDSLSRTYVRIHALGGRLVSETVKCLESGGTAPLAESLGKPSYYSWPAKEDVKAFLRGGSVLLRIKDFSTALFQDPENADKF